MSAATTPAAHSQFDEITDDLARYLPNIGGGGSSSSDDEEENTRIRNTLHDPMICGNCQLVKFCRWCSEDCWCQQYCCHDCEKAHAGEHRTVCKMGQSIALMKRSFVSLQDVRMHVRRLLLHQIVQVCRIPEHFHLQQYTVRPHPLRALFGDDQDQDFLHFTPLRVHWILENLNYIAKSHNQSLLPPLLLANQFFTPAYRNWFISLSSNLELETTDLSAMLKPLKAHLGLSGDTTFQPSSNWSAATYTTNGTVPPPIINASSGQLLCPVFSAIASRTMANDNTPPVDTVEIYTVLTEFNNNGPVDNAQLAISPFLDYLLEVLEVLVKDARWTGVGFWKVAKVTTNTTTTGTTCK
jgi:hypothetical protein